METQQSPRFSLLHTHTFVSCHYPVPPSAPTQTPSSLLLSHTLQLKHHVSWLQLEALPLAVFM